MNIPNTNFKISEGQYIIDFWNGLNGQECDKKLVICKDYKLTVKKYNRAGYKIFATPMQYLLIGGEPAFVCLTRSFRVSTKHGATRLISNAMYFINKAVAENSLTIEI